MNNKIFSIKFWSDNIEFWTIVTLQYYYYKLFKSSRKFQFKEEKYNYFYHRHNTTYKNERTIEIPIINRFVEEHSPKNILEIGNVLSHYFNVKHDVIDKYEIFNGVINQDVADFQLSKKYSLIISISTLEHVGWDEEPRDPQKIFLALKNLKDHLVPGGKLVVTIPLGQNPFLDKYLETGKIKFSENHYFKKISNENQWKEIEPNFPENKHGSCFSGTNTVFIGIYYE